MTIIICLQYYIQLTVVMIDIADKLWFMSSIPVNFPRVTMGASALCTLAGVLCGLTIVHSPRQSVGCIISAVVTIGMCLCFMICVVIKPINAHLNEKVDSLVAQRSRNSRGKSGSSDASQAAAQKPGRMQTIKSSVELAPERTSEPSVGMQPTV